MAGGHGEKFARTEFYIISENGFRISIHLRTLTASLTLTAAGLSWAKRVHARNVCVMMSCDGGNDWIVGAGDENINEKRLSARGGSSSSTSSSTTLLLQPGVADSGPVAGGGDVTVTITLAVASREKEEEEKLANIVAEEAAAIISSRLDRHDPLYGSFGCSICRTVQTRYHFGKDGRTCKTCRSVVERMCEQDRTLELVEK